MFLSFPDALLVKVVMVVGGIGREIHIRHGYLSRGRASLSVVA